MQEQLDLFHMILMKGGVAYASTMEHIALDV